MFADRSWAAPPRVDRRPGQKFGGRAKESTYAYFRPTNRVLQLDSWLERRAFVVFSADRDVVDIRAQRKLTYKDRGVWREHFLDLVPKEATNKVTGVIVKPLSRKDEGEDIKKRIEDTSPDWQDFVHDLRVMTEEQFSLAAVQNSVNILIERRCFVESEYHEVVEDVRQFKGEVMFHDLLKRGPSEAARRTALWNMIDRGLLRLVGPGRIKDTSYVQYVGE